VSTDPTSRSPTGDTTPITPGDQVRLPHSLGVGVVQSVTRKNAMVFLGERSDRTPVIKRFPLDALTRTGLRVPVPTRVSRARPTGEDHA
jgi:hypothetical protein